MDNGVSDFLTGFFEVLLTIVLFVVWAIAYDAYHVKHPRPVYTRPRLDPYLRMAVIRRDGYVCQQMVTGGGDS
jgi:hypothetical protein